MGKNKIIIVIIIKEDRFAKDCPFRPSILGQIKSRSSPYEMEDVARKDLKKLELLGKV